MAIDTQPALELLAAWARNAEHYWYPIPGHPNWGCYGTGYNAWGVQTNQKYMAALATLATQGDRIADLDRQWALERGLAALRFSLASHLSGPGACTDGTQWGHTWISSLGLERVMHAVYALQPHLGEADQADLRCLLASEADWLLNSHQRGNQKGVFADVWNDSGKNAPESNIWNGAALWRAAVMYPDHPQAATWKERAHEFLINGVSVATDAADDTLVARRRVRKRYVGANFFPSYALDHHGYLNAGYMVICVSNAAMLHFDLRLLGLPAPATLDRHQQDLWQVVRRLIAPDGRLLRIGGDSRVRYAYCQEYLLPSLLYAADHLGDAHAPALAEAQVKLMQSEAAHNGDGSFYGKRLARLAAASPYYYTRLESDRACALSQLCAYAPLVKSNAAPQEDFEASVAGQWSEPEHGAAMQRSSARLASFAWRAYGLTQGMCQPPANSHLADWEHNLCSQIELASDPHSPQARQKRRLLRQQITTFEGGFLTSGAVMEGAEIELAEGWLGRDLAEHQIVFAALPDDRTVACLELCRLGHGRAYVAGIKGMHFNLANDLYNAFRRKIVAAHGEWTIISPAGHDDVTPLRSAWLNVDDCLGLVGIYGADTLSLGRSSQRRGGRYQSLYVDEICWGCQTAPRWFDAGATILDCGWAVLSGADVTQTKAAAGSPLTRRTKFSGAGVRGLTITGADGRCYLLAANFGAEEQTVFLPAAWRDVAQPDGSLPHTIAIAAGGARLLATDQPGQEAIP